MATSKITLYRSEITPERNAVIDDIQNYLAEKCTKTYEADKFQYQRLAINQEVTIAVEQSKVGDQTLGNYADILQDGKHFYYFVVNAIWKSTNAVSFVLSLDTLNTFRTELKFTAQTTIHREHIDRFRDIKEDDFDYEPHIGEHDTIRLIDKQVEGLPTVKVLENSEKIKDNNLEDLDWYLIYKTRDDLTKDNIGNPIECDLLANKAITITKATGVEPPQVFTKPTFMIPGRYYYIDPVNNPDAEVNFGLDSPTGVKLAKNKIWKFYSSNNKICATTLTYTQTGNSFTFKEETEEVSYGRVKFIKSNLFTVSEFNIKNYTDIVNLPIKQAIITGSQTGTATIPFSDVDKTNSKLMKIIKLPYCPIEITRNSDGTHNIPENWSLKNGYLVLSSYNLSEEFLNKVNQLDIDKYLKAKLNVNPKSSVNVDNESKFYSSEFFDYKLVYDSFVLPVRLEDFKYTSSWASEYAKPIKIGIEFKPTNTVNSNFAFKLDTDITQDIEYTNRSDYENYLIVRRNNEETIFSNDYINYIRNGLRYDTKARDLELGRNIGGTIMSGIAGAAHIGLPMYHGIRQFDRGPGAAMLNQEINGVPITEDPTSMAVYTNKRKSAAFAGFGGASIAAVAGVSAISNTISGIVNTAMSYQNANNSIEAKKAQYAAQATNVQGSDDVDLLGYYNGNRLELKTYDLEANNKKALLDLFHYAGYAHRFREIPQIYSRYWFNYIQCSPIFDNENTSVYSNYLDDIKLRFEKGVTIYHHHPEIDTGWDIDQRYENWETSLLSTENLPTTKAELGANEFVYSDARPFPKMNFNIVVPLNTNYEEFQFRYIDMGGRDHYATTKTNWVNLMTYNKTSAIYVRRKNFLNEALSSDWTKIYN